MTTFLFEILSEEIPADLQESGASHLYELFNEYSAESAIFIKNYQIFYSSQRIAIMCNLKIEKKEIIRNVRGPRIGVDEKILQAFLSSQKNQNFRQIEIENKYHGLEFKEILNENQEKIEQNLSQICLKTLQNFAWSDTTMSWKSYLPKWIRPIRSILCILNNDIIHFEFAGIKSSNKTRGHKILTRWRDIVVKSPEKYEQRLEKKLVIVDQNIRKKMSTQNISNVDLTDKNIINLIDELSCIAEYPMVMKLKIENEFLSLPDDLIQYIMIAHQRYIPKIENGKLSNEYYVIIDHNDSNSTMEGGYRRVLNARLSDGKFYWDKFINTDFEILIEDLKATKSEYIPKISVYDFNQKISEIFINSDSVHQKLNSESCDLSSDLITEYPALRGLMAKEYMIRNKLNNDEKPCNNLYYGESELYEKFVLPTHSFEKAIIFAKNMLKAEYFIIEKREKPTSSRDPFQIRKAIENGIGIIFNDYLNNDSSDYSECSEHYFFNRSDDENFKNIFFDVLLNFYYKNNESLFNLAKLENKIIDIGYHHFMQKNILNYSFLKMKKFSFEQIQFIKNLSSFSWQDGTFQAYKRVVQICSKKYKDFDGEINENLILLQEEKNFFILIQSCNNECNFNKIQNIDFQNQIYLTINNFFDNIHIEDEDEQIKNNRIALLVHFYNSIENFIPISKLS